MCHLDLIEYKLHGYLNSSLGKNLSRYSYIGIWLTITLEALVQSKLEYPKYLSYDLSLVIDGSIGFESSSRSSKKCCPLLFNAWKCIFQLLRMLFHLFFLLKSHKDLHGKIGVRLNFFVSLSTIAWKPQLLWLRHSQNSMRLLLLCSKNSLSL